MTSESSLQLRVLVAEDDATSRRILETILHRWGLDVVSVADGRGAWEILSGEDAPSLAILDWLMPEVEGVEICRRIRRVATDRPPYLIMLSARDTKADLVEALDAGADDYITKPFDLAELRARIGVGQRVLALQAKLAALNEELGHQATHDRLTGVLNRGAVLDLLARELVRCNRESRELTVGLCDLDHFKQINDTYGHQTGDDALCEFIRRVESTVRPYDRLGRYGGEEFLLLLPGLGADAGARVLQRVCDAVSATPMVGRNGAKFEVSVSIGGMATSGSAAAERILAATDRALYRAKEEGRNRVVYVHDLPS
jgi:diguanylate cyclase (GGDEF)-like protein